MTFDYIHEYRTNVDFKEPLLGLRWIFEQMNNTFMPHTVLAAVGLKITNLGVDSKNARVHAKTATS